MDDVTALQPGEQAPEFALKNQDGEIVTLKTLLGSKVIAYFYPAAGTPGCTTEACDFRDNLVSLQDLGYTVVGISPDAPERLAEWAQEERLTYPLLSDQDLEAHKLYGAWGEKTVNGESMIGPLRSTFVIDEDGVVRHALYDVKPQGHVAELRELLVSRA